MDEQTTIRKALTIAAGGAYGLLPVELNVAGGIRDYVSEQPVLYNMLPKIPWATTGYYIRLRTANPTATWGTDGGALPGATMATYAKVFKSVKYLYTRGEVTGPMQKAAGTLFNALAMEVERHSFAMVDALSSALITGTGGSDDIEGLIYQLGTSGDGNDLNAGDGYMDKNGTALSLNLVDQAIDQTRGEADMIVTSFAVRRKLATLLQAQQRFNDTTVVGAGFRVATYQGIPIVVDRHWQTGRDLLFFKRADTKILVHEDFTYEDLAKTKDSYDFFIKWYGGFVVEGRPAHLYVADVGSV